MFPRQQTRQTHAYTCAHTSNNIMSTLPKRDKYNHSLKANL